MSSTILQLSHRNATLENVGGKGLSLAKLSRAGFPVPDGFHVTTEAYRRFVSENGLQSRILEATAATDATYPDSLETASQRIGKLFAEAQIPKDIAEAIIDAYIELKGAPVAVRSSATAEDLPEASFAGQQETYLNVQGRDALLDAVKRCWASLWTARAIGYRLRNGIDEQSLALAVVVQELVPAETSGVMFTANPLNGRRNEIVINAAWGLGEAVVSGLVTPDTITADKSTGRLLQRMIAVKQVMTVRTDTGTREQPVPTPLQKKAALTTAQAKELARLGAKIEDLYGMPMDIEWACSRGRFAILQARPITSLPDPPLDWNSPNPKALLMRMSFAEFVPGAISPLFATLGVPIAEKASQALMGAYLGLNDRDSYLFAVVNGYVYVGMVLGPKMLWAMATGVMTGTVQKMLKTSQARWTVMSEKYHKVVERWQEQELASLSPTTLLAAANEIFACTAEYYNVAQSGPIPAASSSELSFSRIYSTFIKRKRDPEATIFLLGLDSLPLRAEKSLFDLAQWIKAQPDLEKYFLHAPVKDICTAAQSHVSPGGLIPAWVEFCSRFNVHLGEFGHTVYDLDFAKPVPADDPAPLIETIKAYLDGKGSDPYARQKAAAEKREQATQMILKRLDPLRKKWFQKLLRWAQEAAPRREDCIGDLGLGYPILRKVFAELGRRLAANGAILWPEDIYWLEAGELNMLAAALEQGENLSSLNRLVDQRKANWQRVRSADVPQLLPEKSFFSKFMAHDHKGGNQLKGFGASVGRVTARACVLRDPQDFSQMRPGDVIVAVTTTPAWTPLFAIASAVVTEIGGPLSHSSIVAREYGIPAVLAVGSAVRRIKSGQTITVDGTLGRVILDTEEQPMSSPKKISLPSLAGNLLVVILGLAAVLFLSAGRLDWPQAWFFLLAFGGFLTFYGLWALANDPDQLTERSQVGPNTKSWDRVILTVYTFLLFSMLVLAGLDAVRFSWAPASLALQALGWLGAAFAGFLVWWTVSVNTYLSRTVRIQSDRGQRVVESGPYSRVRHPMYLGVIVLMVSIPLLLGSRWALLPGALIGALFVLRTALEDRTLQQELPGYLEYARRVRYRLVPWIW